MSLTSALRPSALPFKTPDLSAYRSNNFSPSGTSNDNTSRPFQQDPDYINLKRMLIRFQHLILLTPSPTGDSLPLTSTSESLELLSPIQRQIQAELWSALPYHRTKWLRNIEGARTLLLRLERVAQAIRVARVKGQVLRDLAEKRSAIKKLRNRVEEIGREVEEGTEQGIVNNGFGQENELLGETVYEILKKKKGTLGDVEEGGTERLDDISQQGKPVQIISQDESQVDETEQSKRDQLLGTSSSSSIRRRAGKEVKDAETTSSSKDHSGKTTGFSTSQSTETALLDSSRTQESLTASLVSMAAQLKQQSRAFQFALEQDKGILNLALEGLDKNLTGMEAASKNMAFLKRMSEGEGWLGRLKLYGLILGLWVVAILLVFVGPKLRF